MIEGIFVEGFIFSIMVIGIFITFKIMNMADMTCDGAVALGAAVAAVCLKSGLGVFASTLIATASGALAGVVTALIHCKLKVPALLAGILTMTMLYSVNLRIMGGANMPLLGVNTLFRMLPGPVLKLVAAVGLMLIAKVLMDLFFRMDMGITIGAMGGNEQVVISQGINPQTLKIIGFGFSNALIAYSGALLAQYQGFADVNLGTGMLVQGLASIMLGEFLFSTNKISLLTLQVILGSLIYKALMYFGRRYGYLVGISANDFKLLTGVLVILCLIIAQGKNRAAAGSARKKAVENLAGEND